MRLDAWLKQPHTPAERLRLIERLAQALNAVHDRGEVLASIAPEHVNVGNDLAIDLAPAARGRPEPGYAAPERLEGAAPSAAADIYAVGSLCWEALVGRPCGEAPKPLAEVAPDVPRELANSVMGCLERSPEWRPKDLTYLAQLAAAQQKAARGPEPKASPRAERAAPPPRAGAAPRPAPRRASRSHLPLLVAAVLLIAAAASSYLWLHREEARPSATARAAAPQPPPVAAEPKAPATPTPAPAASQAATPEPIAAEPTALPVATLSAEPTPAPTPEPTPTPTPTPEPASVPTPEPRAASAAPQEPSSLSAVSPLSVRRPGKVLLDIRGSGLRANQRVRVLPLKENPRGITVVRQKWTSSSLVSVLIELDASVTPTAYAIALEDPAGALTNPLQLVVTK